VAKRRREARISLTIRIPPELRQELARLAKERGVSLNAEIILRLQAAIAAETVRPLFDELRALLEEARKKSPGKGP